MGRSIKFFLFGLFVASGIVLLIASTQPDNAVNRALDQFKEFYISLDENYVDTLDHKILVKKTIKAAVSELDPHSHYYDSLETEDRKKKWKGVQYVGIGVNLKKIGEEIVITYCREGYGADSSGLLPGDIIEQVNYTSVTNLAVKEVVTKLRGETGTVVKVRIRRGEQLLNKKIVRKEVVNRSITYSELHPNGVGVIRIDQFLEGGAKEFRRIITGFENSGSKGLVIDLRNNPGGLLKGSIGMLSCFLHQNSLVCELKGKDQKSNYQNLTKLNPVNTEVPIVLLINNKTISAAEVMAGCLQDYDRGVLVGDSTWGKGLVQGTRYLSDGSSLYITTARYYLPSGRCIQEKDYSSDLIKTSSVVSESMFYTSTGRKVESGNGVSPDILMIKHEKSEFVKAAIRSQLIFEFAVGLLRSGNFEEIKVNEYLSYIKGRNDRLILSSEKWINKLEENELDFNKEVAGLRSTLEDHKIELIDKYSNELVIELKRELEKQTKYKKGRYIYDLQRDEVYAKAVELLLDQNEYNRILNRTND